MPDHRPDTTSQPHPNTHLVRPRAGAGPGWTPKPTTCWPPPTTPPRGHRADHTLHQSATLHRHLRGRGHYTQAALLHQRALHMPTPTSEPPAEHDALNGLGNIHRLQGRYGPAADCFEQALGQRPPGRPPSPPHRTHCAASATSTTPRAARAGHRLLRASTRHRPPNRQRHRRTGRAARPRLHRLRAGPLPAGRRLLRASTRQRSPNRQPTKANRTHSTASAMSTTPRATTGRPPTASSKHWPALAKPATTKPNTTHSTASAMSTTPRAATGRPPTASSKHSPSLAKPAIRQAEQNALRGLGYLLLRGRATTGLPTTASSRQ